MFEQDLTQSEDNEKDNSSESSPEETTKDQTQSDEGEQTQTEDQDDSGEEQEGSEESEGEEEQEEGEGEEGEKQNLHENPRWKEREDDWKDRFNEQETRHVTAVNEMREEFDKKLTGLQPKEAITEAVPEWWGGDAEQYQSFKVWNTANLEANEKSVIEKMTAAQNADTARVTEAQEYMNSEVEAIQKDPVLNPTGGKIDKNKLLKIVLDNDLVDSDGKWNYKVGMRLMSQTAPKAVDKTDRKNLANATGSDRHSETQKSNVMTSKDFNDPTKRPW